MNCLKECLLLPHRILSLLLSFSFLGFFLCTYSYCFLSRKGKGTMTWISELQKIQKNLLVSFSFFSPILWIVFSCSIYLMKRREYLYTFLSHSRYCYVCFFCVRKKKKKLYIFFWGKWHAVAVASAAAHHKRAFFYLYICINGRKPHIFVFITESFWNNEQVGNIKKRKKRQKRKKKRIFISWQR